MSVTIDNRKECDAIVMEGSSSHQDSQALSYCVRGCKFDAHWFCFCDNKYSVSLKSIGQGTCCTDGDWTNIICNFISQFRVNHLWPSATKWGSLRGVSKVRKVFCCNKHYFLHILMQKWLLCDIPIKSYKMLNITMYNIIQNNFTEKWAVKDFFVCVLLWANQEANVS